MERISLGALIIALCMLTDNAIIVIEGIKVGIEAGRDKLQVVREVVSQNQWPLFGATAIGIIAFAAIGLSEDSTGEYCNSLFWVILISLSLSWVSSITVTPLLSYLFFKPNDRRGSRQPRPLRRAVLSHLSQSADLGASLSLVGRGALARAICGGAVGLYEDRPELFSAGHAAAVYGGRVSAVGHAHSRHGGVRRRRWQVHPGTAGRYPRHVVHRRRRLAVLARVHSGKGEPSVRPVFGRRR